MMINESKMGRLCVVDSERKIFSGEFDFVELRGAPGDRCLIDLTLRCPRSGKEMYAKLDNCVRTVSAGPVCLFAKFDHNGCNEPRVAYPACEAAHGEDRTSPPLSSIRFSMTFSFCSIARLLSVRQYDDGERLVLDSPVELVSRASSTKTEFKSL